MKIVRPFTATTATLTSNVVETPPAAYAGGTTYALGAQASIFSGVNSTTATIYQSLQAGNTGNAPASSPLWWVAVGTAYLAYNAGTAYSIDAVVSDTTNHLLYQSLANANTGNALTDTTKWLELGATNRWAMFDQKNGTQTSWYEEVQATLDVTGRADTLALLNLSGSALNVTVMDGATEVYNQDFSLVDNAGVGDWYAYFFEPVVRMTDKTIDDLPNVGTPSITATVTATAATVSVGNMVVGQSWEPGLTHHGASGGIIDYSRKTTDDFGNTYIAERGFAKKWSFSMRVPANKVDQTFNVISAYRATPVLVIGAIEYSSTTLYGLFKEWRVEVDYPTYSLLSVEFEGL
ncbi:MAG: hypothetical protein RL268_201 [Pseudomonadota bacterium]|jgi:hypothetical protein